MYFKVHVLIFEQEVYSRKMLIGHENWLEYALSGIYEENL